MTMNSESLVGKPLVVYIDGERRQIGTVVKAQIVDGKLFTASKLELESEDSPK
jgi:hypothetical protein